MSKKIPTLIPKFLVFILNSDLIAGNLLKKIKCIRAKIVKCKSINIKYKLT